MRVTFTQPAADGTRLAPGCLNSAIGVRYPLEVEGHPAATGIIASATVLPGGESVSITLDIPDDCDTARAIAEAGGGPGPFGIAEDGRLYRPVPVRRRAPGQARAYLDSLDLGSEMKALMAEIIEPE